MKRLSQLLNPLSFLSNASSLLNDDKDHKNNNNNNQNKNNNNNNNIINTYTSMAQPLFPKPDSSVAHVSVNNSKKKKNSFDTAHFDCIDYIVQLPVITSPNTTHSRFLLAMDYMLEARHGLGSMDTALEHIIHYYDMSKTELVFCEQFNSVCLFLEFRDINTSMKAYFQLFQFFKTIFYVQDLKNLNELWICNNDECRHYNAFNENYKSKYKSNDHSNVASQSNDDYIYYCNRCKEYNMNRKIKYIYTTKSEKSESIDNNEEYKSNRHQIFSVHSDLNNHSQQSQSSYNINDFYRKPRKNHNHSYNNNNKMQYNNGNSQYLNNPNQNNRHNNRALTDPSKLEQSQSIPQYANSHSANIMQNKINAPMTALVANHSAPPGFNGDNDHKDNDEDAVVFPGGSLLTPTGQRDFHIKASDSNLNNNDASQLRTPGGKGHELMIGMAHGNIQFNNDHLSFPKRKSKSFGDLRIENKRNALKHHKSFPITKNVNNNNNNLLQRNSFSPVSSPEMLCSPVSSSAVSANECMSPPMNGNGNEPRERRSFGSEMSVESTCSTVNSIEENLDLVTSIVANLKTQAESLKIANNNLLYDGVTMNNFEEFERTQKNVKRKLGVLYEMINGIDQEFNENMKIHRGQMIGSMKSNLHNHKQQAQNNNHNQFDDDFYENQAQNNTQTRGGGGLIGSDGDYTHSNVDDDDDTHEDDDDDDDDTHEDDDRLLGFDNPNGPMTLFGHAPTSQ